MELISDIAAAEAVFKSGKPSIIDFYADWCAICLKAMPMLEAMERERPELKMYKVNVGESPEIGRRFNCHGVPLFIGISAGGDVLSRAGLADETEILRLAGLK